MLLILDSIHGIYCDALVDDDGYLVFASLWGRDTAIQELLARLTLKLHEGGLLQLDFRSPVVPSLKEVVRIGNPDRLDKMTGRMPKKNIFGEIVHLWIFDKRVRKPDYSNRSAYFLNPHIKDHDGSKVSNEIDEQIWQLVKSVCHLPLLDLWQAPIMGLLVKKGWVEITHGYEIDNVSINLPEAEFDEVISQMIVAGNLCLDKEAL